MTRKYLEPSAFLQVWVNANNGIWATNTPDGKFGRSLDANIIATQAATISRGISVTRVFVLEEDESAESRRTLREVVKAQLNVGIVVYVIARRQFETATSGAKEVLGNDDFVVVDRKCIYVTTQDGQKYAIDVADSPDEFAYAMELQEKIERGAKMITSQNRISELIPLP